MIVYQLVARFRDHLENVHKEHSRKVFLDRSMAVEYQDRFKTIVEEDFGSRMIRGGIVITIIELEVVE